jgi:flagellar biosynthesis/type III secretory pathway protein FliH
MLGDSAVKIRVSPEDAPHIHGPVIADPELGFGDIVFETDDGEIDMRLGTRIAGLLRNQQVQL